MTEYGSIDGYQRNINNNDHLQRRSSRRRHYDVFAHHWVRAAVACGLLVILTLSSHRSVKHKLSTELDAPKDDVTSADAQDFSDETLELLYHDQLVHHHNGKNDTWSNRYYQTSKYWKGPGRPIFLIVGGEDALNGMLYPFISRHLASHFGAAVINIEHRFYGPYQPITGRKATVAELLELLTLKQAMADMIRLTRHYKDKLNCNFDRSTEKYCPVITVGGSYPGVLSALLRLVYPEFVDISYASSAPLVLHAQQANQNSFYDIVTRTAEETSKGGEMAVRSALNEANVMIRQAFSVKDAAKSLNMCTDTIPEYISNLDTLSDDIMMAIGFTFADFDMGAYPPSKDLELYKACQVFQDDATTSSLAKVSNFFQLLKEVGSEEDFPGLKDRDCFNLSIFLPDGENPRIATSDWTGAGAGNDGMMWDFQLCTTYIAPVGFSEKSMFPERKWSLDKLTRYCQRRYGKVVIPQPYKLVDDFGIDDLVREGASRILFTNGMKDLWSGGSHLKNLSDSIVALNFKNGAHHSDLTHKGPSEEDTEDIKEGFATITNILQSWLDLIRVENKSAEKNGN